MDVHPFEPMPHNARLCDTCGQPQHYAPGGEPVHGGWADDDGDEEDERPDVVDHTTMQARRLSEMCRTCIMRPAHGGRIELRPGGLRAFLADVLARDSFVVCHATIYRDDGVLPAICRGFADRFTSNYLRIMERLGGFADVPPPPEREGAL